MKKSKVGRKKIDKKEKKVPLQYYVKSKNKQPIDAVIRPIIEKMDK